MSESYATADDPLIGTHIDGRYTILGVLGQGGMGIVYDGLHDELGRAVAIKVLNTAWASDRTAVERFLREARTASSFSHGNIVDVSDLGRLPDGRPYLVMPKIHGIDLATLLYENGPQPAKRVGELLRGVAAALDLIHAKGYVHRDIKPENLMYVAREDGSETVMLLDFGIAALMMSNQRRLTGVGQVFGTPHYMPPEASTGALPDARADVYALATVAFELITGRLPFESENLMQVLTMKLVDDPPTLASASGQAFPPELEDVLARGLARDANQRYGTTGDLIRSILDVTEHAQVSWRSGVLRSTLHSDVHPLEIPQHTSAPPAWEESAPSHRPSGRPSQRPSQRPSNRTSNRSPYAQAHAAHGSTHELGAGLRESERLRYTAPVRVSKRWPKMIGALVVCGGAIAAWFVLQDGRPAPLQASSAPLPVPAIQAPAKTVQPARATPTAAVIEPQPPTAAVPVAALPMAIAPAAPAPTIAAPTTPPTAEAQPSVAQPSAPPTAAAPLAQHTQAPTIAPKHTAEPNARPQRRPEYELPAAAIPPEPSPVQVEPEPAPVAAANDGQEAEQPEPDHARVTQLTQSATAALLRGEVSRAVELLRSATQLDPSSALSWRSLGLALERSGDSAGAIDAYRRCLRLVPTGLQADLVRGRVRGLEQQ